MSWTASVHKRPFLSRASKTVCDAGGALRTVRPAKAFTGNIGPKSQSGRCDRMPCFSSRRSIIGSFTIPERASRYQNLVGTPLPPFPPSPAQDYSHLSSLCTVPSGYTIKTTGAIVYQAQNCLVDGEAEFSVAFVLEPLLCCHARNSLLCDR